MASRARGGSSSGNLFSSPEARIAESNRRLVEEQNNAKTSALAESVERLKLLSIDIKDEVVDHNRILDGMDGQMSSASEMLGETLGKLGALFNTGEGKHMLYLIVFVVGAFVILYTYFVKMETDEDR